jgi:Zn finger protein HypA/HybF involved in hydrogenase expression
MAFSTAQMKPYRGAPATLGSTAAAQVQIIVWCRDCRHRVERDPAELAARYGAETSIPDWAARLVCPRCGGREVDFVLTGAPG